MEFRSVAQPRLLFVTPWSPTVPLLSVRKLGQQVEQLGPRPRRPGPAPLASLCLTGRRQVTDMLRPRQRPSRGGSGRALSLPPPGRSRPLSPGLVSPSDRRLCGPASPRPPRPTGGSAVPPPRRRRGHPGSAGVSSTCGVFCSVFTWSLAPSSAPAPPPASIIEENKRKLSRTNEERGASVAHALRRPPANCTGDSVCVTGFWFVFVHHCLVCFLVFTVIYRRR